MMLRLKDRFFGIFSVFAVIALSFILLLLFISYANADNVNELIQAPNEPNEACEAAKALAKEKASQAADTFVEIIKNNKNPRIRRCATEALANLGDRRSIDLLVASLQDKNPRIASRVAGELGFLKDKRAVKPLLYALTELNIPCPAARALGKIKDPDSVTHLINALRHENMRARSCAATALGMIGDSRACEPLTETFMHDSDPSTQDSARRALEVIGCSFEEHAQEYAIEDNFCNTGQEMIDYISSNMKKHPNQKSFTESEELKNYFSKIIGELNRLDSANPEASKKLYGVFFLVSDWADSLDRLRKISHSSDKEMEKIIFSSAVERVKDKETRLRVICPEMKIPDYSQ